MISTSPPVSSANPSVKLLHPGAAPVALCLARLAGIRELVETATSWHPTDNSTSPGILAESLVAALLCGCRPLYKVERFWQNNGYVNLFYQSDDVSGEQLNDDAYGRLLDRLSRIDCRRLFESICLRMLQHHDLVIDLTYTDTSSISVEGAYLTKKNGISCQSQVEERFCLTHGHSKDHRSDLKQFKISVSVQKDGLPISGKLLSGNASDQKWNPQAVEELSAMLLENGYKDLIFVADSALISGESLHTFALRDIQFISRFPETFNLAEELKIQAWEANNWENLGILAENTKGAAYYRTWRTQGEVEGEICGFTVVHSSNLEERKGKTLQKAIERDRKELERQSKKLSKTKYACEADARRDGELLQKSVEKKGFPGELKVERIEIVKYGHRGRPKKGEVGKKEITWRVEVQIEPIKEEVYEQRKKLESTFVLIHRLKEEKNSEDIVRSYKNQNKVEENFKFLKQPQYLGPVYTKTTSRVESLGYIFLMVLLLAKYLEYRVRVSMQQSEGELKIGGQKVMRPSAKTILEILDMMLSYAMDGEVRLSDDIDKDILNVIHWAGFHEDIYIHGYMGDRFMNMR
jgi:transposase